MKSIGMPATSSKSLFSSLIFMLWRRLGTLNISFVSKTLNQRPNLAFLDSRCISIVSGLDPSTKIVLGTAELGLLDALDEFDCRGEITFAAHFTLLSTDLNLLIGCARRSVESWTVESILAANDLRFVVAFVEVKSKSTCWRPLATRSRLYHWISLLDHDFTICLKQFTTSNEMGCSFLVRI